MRIGGVSRVSIVYICSHFIDVRLWATHPIKGKIHKVLAMNLLHCKMVPRRPLGKNVPLSAVLTDPTDARWNGGEFLLVTSLH
jgi:hypothetical protein